MDELSEFQRGMHPEQYKHICPLVIQLGGMHLYLIESGKMKWANTARNSQDEILKLRIENEWLRMVARVLADNSAMAAKVRELLAAHMKDIAGEPERRKPDGKDFYQ